MLNRTRSLTMAMMVLPAALAAQAKPAPPPAPAPAPAAAPAPSNNPVTDALRQQEQRFARILIAAAEAMPAEKYNYRPTPAQMSFAMIQVHLAQEGNDLLCGKVAGSPPPQRSAVDTTKTKEQLVARLRESFEFCEQAFAKLDDSKLGQPIQLFGPRPFTLAAAMFITVGDWADHYSQEANYLRLNGILPPTAQPRSM
ncbi:MAG TPA: DinB family protein [Gemmatimonadales bacterium]|nr:DinB family protein [Gemmatimonadales bacterium]